MSGDEDAEDLRVFLRLPADAQFERFFRRVYQHYGSLEGYSKLPDAEVFLPWMQEKKASHCGRYCRRKAD